MNLSKLAYSFIILISSVTILIVAKPILIPFIIALIIWFLIKELKIGLKKVSYVGKKIPSIALTLIASLLIFMTLGLIVKMITNNIQVLSLNLQEYEDNINVSIAQINLTFDINVLEHLKGFSKGFDFSNLFQIILKSLTDLFGKTFLILIYVIFLLLEETVFNKKIKAIYHDNKKFKHTTDILSKIEKSISNYLTLKTLTSALTGVLSYFVLLFIGVDAPVFWAFLIFILNFIPTVGSLIATAFPTIFALLQFGTIATSLHVLLMIIAIQILVGNILEPKIMGKSLNISSLVVILSLTFWGAIWGITGMILSVPITVVMIILFAEFPKTRFIAIFLSEQGDIGDAISHSGKTD
jgi:AI-2 transport protein TqsA